MGRAVLQHAPIFCAQVIYIPLTELPEARKGELRLISSLDLAAGFFPRPPATSHRKHIRVAHLL